MSWLLPPPWWLPVIAYAVDLAVGDPRWLVHPVQMIGALVAWLEGRLRPLASTPGALRLAGSVLVALVVGVTWVATAGLLYIAGRLHPALGVALHVWLFATTLAARGLGQAGLHVLRPLRAGDLSAARAALSNYVGRDTAELPADQVVRAAVETVAENCSDGLVAPLLFGLLGGAPLAMAYKAVNTMDSMLGYKNERYLYFGWAAARLDDLANWLPARLTALLLAVAAVLTGRPLGRTLRVLGRDARKHASPNSGFPEAAMAGALGVRLGGPLLRKSKLHQLPYLGEAAAPLAPEQIAQAVWLMHLTGALALALGCLILWTRV